MPSTMATNHVLRVPRTDTDNDDDYVIINTVSEGKDAKQIILEGTESETAFYTMGKLAIDLLYHFPSSSFFLLEPACLLQCLGICPTVATQLTHHTVPISALESARDHKCPLSVPDFLATLLHTLLPALHPAPDTSSVREPEPTDTQISFPQTSATATTPSATAPSSLSTPKSAPTFTATASSQALTLTLRLPLGPSLSARLGVLSVPSSDTHDIDTLSWVSTSVLYSQSLLANRDDALRQAHEHKQALERVMTQMQDLVREKEESERKMLAATKALVNAKKVKIRALMRVVEAGGARDWSGRERGQIKEEKEEEESVEGMEVDAAANGEDAHGKEKGKSKGRAAAQGSRRVAPSRKGKRKQAEENLPQEIDESEDESDDFEQMAGTKTPERGSGDEDTETEDEEDGGDAGKESPPPAAKKKIGAIGKGKGKADGGSTGAKASGGSRLGGEHPTRVLPSRHAASQGINPQVALQGKSSTPPPRRDLPFAAKKKVTSDETVEKAPEKDTAMGDGGEVGGGTLEEDDETDDDEL
jgi:hypothetical protein